MPKLSLILGVIATLLFIAAWSAMSFLVHGEDDWDLGIMLVLCMLAAFGISLIGGVSSLVAFCRSPAKRTTAVLGLALSLTPWLIWFVSWMMVQMWLR